MTTVSSTFAAKGASTAIPCRKGSRLSWVVSGTYVARWHLQRKVNLANWENILTFTGNSTDGIDLPEDGEYRLFCSSRTSGTITYALTDANTVILSDTKTKNGVSILRVDEDGVSTLVRIAQKRIINVGGKVGATAGWVVAAADNLGLLATLPASQTGSTLVLRVSGLKVGDTITGFHLIGQIESAGGAVTVDADLRKITAAAADVTDASVGAITQLAIVADTIMSAANTEKASLAEVVAADETFYVLITATTAAATDIALQGVAITVTEA